MPWLRSGHVHAPPSVHGAASVGVVVSPVSVEDEQAAMIGIAKRIDHTRFIGKTSKQPALMRKPRRFVAGLKGEMIERAPARVQTCRLAWRCTIEVGCSSGGAMDRRDVYRAMAASSGCGVERAWCATDHNALCVPRRGAAVARMTGRKARAKGRGPARTIQARIDRILRWIARRGRGRRA